MANERKGSKPKAAGNDLARIGAVLSIARPLEWGASAMLDGRRRSAPCHRPVLELGRVRRTRQWLLSAGL